MLESLLGGLAHIFQKLCGQVFNSLFHTADLTSRGCERPQVRLFMARAQADGDPKGRGELLCLPLPYLNKNGSFPRELELVTETIKLSQ